MMKKFLATICLCVMLVPTAWGETTADQTGKVVLDWTREYIEAMGQAVPPTGKENTAQGKLLAQRGAVVDVQRNLLEFIKGVQVTSRTTLDNFMADDMARTSISGMVKNVNIVRSEWDGEIYTVWGRIPLQDIRQAMAPSIKAQVAKEAAPKHKKAKKRSGHTGLVLDCRNLPLIPALTFRILSQSGKEVYSFDRVEMEHFLASGLCDYHTNMGWAKDQPRVAASPLIITPTGLVATQNVDIVVSNKDASRIAALPDSVIHRCRVSIVKR